MCVCVCGGGSRGVKILRLIIALHTLKLSPQNIFGELNTKRLVKRKALRKLLAHLLPSERCLCIPFLRTKWRSNGSDEKSVSHKKTTGLI